MSRSESHDPIAVLKSRRVEILAAVGAITLLTLVFGFDVVFQGRTLVSWPLNHLGETDRLEAAGLVTTAPRLADPWAGFLIEAPGIEITHRAFQEGRIPLWNPHEGCGVPYLADGELAVLSVLQAPLHWLGLEYWDAWVLARMGLAAFSACLLILALGHRFLPAVIGGMAFGFGGNFVLQSNLVHLNGTAVLPLVVLCLLAWTHRNSAARFLALTFAFALALNGGNPQPLVALGTVVAPLLVLAGARRGIARRFLSIGGVGLAGVLGAALTAASLLPMAELLQSGSLNRTLFDVDATARPQAILAFFAPSYCGTGAHTGPATWYLGGLIAASGLAGLIALTLRGDRNHRGLAIGGLSTLAILFTASMSEIFGAKLPIFRDLNWFKYVGALQLAVIVAASWVLSERRAWTLWFAAALGLGAFALESSRHASFVDADSFDARYLAILVGAAVPLILLAGRRIAAPKLDLALLFVVTAELLWLRPDLPARPEPLLPKQPPPFERLASKRQPTPTGPPARVMGFGDLAPPMYSGLLGWDDPRSVTPLPLAHYHELVSPWVNSGVWPPYLLLGASRQILFSPAIAMTGVGHAFVQDVGRIAVDPHRQPENRSDLFMGELQRAMVPGSLRIERMLMMEADKASCLLEADGLFSMELRAFARTIEFAIQLQSLESDHPPTAQITVGNETRALVADAEEVRFRLEGEAARGFPVSIALGPQAAGRLRFTDWIVDRHLDREPKDWQIVPEGVDQESGVVWLKNRRPLARLRIHRRTRILSADGVAAFMDRFTADGDDFDPHRELLVIGDDLPTISSD
ncbi:MAG: hypothetical protein KDB53_20690, partial [Planctomycetes bacterium]|nr:hypothetical protein [Planctomycetota bacterium]